MNGFINLLKPPGMSSAQAVFFVKKLIREKVGHAGTLDPEAAGVLPIMVGRATKLFDYVADDDKVYVAEIAFGAQTDTQDAQGVVTKVSVHLPTQEDLMAILPKFIGKIAQVPPQYSAIKRDGERLYDLARAGRSVSLAPREVLIRSLRVIRQVASAGYLMEIHCGKGTYIRTLCEDIGQALGSRAYMRFLLRNRVGAFTLDDAYTPEELKEDVEEGAAGGKWMLPLSSALQHIPRIDVPVRLRKPLINGVPLSRKDLDGPCEFEEGALARLYLNNELISISRVSGDLLKIQTMVQLAPP
ncbi:MAG: tRNA pseudouridine(55) synthase TruB [Eubacteriales bacterium]|jgi:tRNA pseudouridine55 synthase|nr:tRNA pseudouridine(55) synthase TruB [Eubacteriales bacterium]MDD4104719.1 tRNA pseudouridine(55) synthase TruB [Eubacteriales bacterium]MDD4710299.1 tRNA pseudouridine(55) synthase TruB [Eubacteriales bacterium]NLO15290.1 tRNA pseudouridine(55) synthase TruB [Clostridiales bacterium]